MRCLLSRPAAGCKGTGDYALRVLQCQRQHIAHRDATGAFNVIQAGSILKAGKVHPILGGGMASSGIYSIETLHRPYITAFNGAALLHVQQRT